MIFFARREAGIFGSESIETHHILLGFLQADPELARELLQDDGAAKIIREAMSERFPFGKEIPEATALPLSSDCKTVLKIAAKERKKLRHDRIRTIHLILGLLQVKGNAASDTLRRFRLWIPDVRKLAIRRPEPPDDWTLQPPERD